jgi:hypothetical protein
MDFIAKYFLYGALFAGPVDRPLFPVQAETDYDSPTVADQVRRFELVGTDRMVIRMGRLANGAFVADTGERSGSTLFLDGDGQIRAECGDRDCDYRQHGWEYVRENGRYARIRSWEGGNIRKTWEITHQDGRLISAAEGLLQVSWFGNDITRQSWMVRQEPPPLFHVLTYTHNPALPDTVWVESENPFGEPQQALQIYHMHQGRLTFRVEMDRSPGGGRYSWTNYRYQAPSTLPTLAPRRTAPPALPFLSVDALGRLGPVLSGAQVPAWHSGTAGSR